MESTWYMAASLVVILIIMLALWARTAAQVRREAEARLRKKEALKAKRRASAARKVDLPMTDEQMARAQNMGMSGANSKGMQPEVTWPWGEKL